MVVRRGFKWFFLAVADRIIHDISEDMSDEDRGCPNCFGIVCFRLLGSWNGKFSSIQRSQQFRWENGRRGYLLNISEPWAERKYWSTALYIIRPFIMLQCPVSTDQSPGFGANTWRECSWLKLSPSLQITVCVQSGNFLSSNYQRHPFFGSF